jgi:hypothetical protein
LDARFHLQKTDSIPFSQKKNIIIINENRDEIRYFKFYDYTIRKKDCKSSLLDMCR